MEDTHYSITPLLHYSTAQHMDIFALLDELQTIARNGLHYTQNIYDRERYERLLSLSTNTYSELLDMPEDAVRTRFAEELGHITPKIGSDAAIFNENGEILLMDRVDGSGWCLPCGWVEPNETPADTAIREAREETGLDIEVKQFVGIFTRMPSVAHGPHTMIAVVHLCDVVGGELTLSHEGIDLGYWAIDDVPRWHTTHEQYARAAYTMWKAESLLPSISA